MFVKQYMDCLHTSNAFTFLHLTDVFIHIDLNCIKGIHFISSCSNRQWWICIVMHVCMSQHFNNLPQKVTALSKKRNVKKNATVNICFLINSKCPYFIWWTNINKYKMSSISCMSPYYGSFKLFSHQFCTLEFSVTSNVDN